MHIPLQCLQQDQHSEHPNLGSSQVKHTSVHATWGPVRVWLQREEPELLCIYSQRDARKRFCTALCGLCWCDAGRLTCGATVPSPTLVVCTCAGRSVSSIEPATGVMTYFAAHLEPIGGHRLQTRSHSTCLQDYH